MQICEYDMNNDLMWSIGPKCDEDDPCSQDPCKHNGVCIKDGGGFRCACNGTGYGGPTCTLAIIYFEYIPPVTDGLMIRVILSTEMSLPTLKVPITVMGPNRYKKKVKK